MKLLICGSRDYENYSVIKQTVKLFKNNYGNDLVIIQGEALGADFLAKLACNELGVGHEDYPAEWNKYGNAAGPIRNKQMLDKGKPEIVYGFSDSIYTSKGTRNMLNQSLKREIPTYLVSNNRTKILKDLI